MNLIETNFLVLLISLFLMIPKGCRSECESTGEVLKNGNLVMRGCETQMREPPTRVACFTNGVPAANGTGHDKGIGDESGYYTLTNNGDMYQFTWVINNVWANGNRYKLYTCSADNDHDDSYYVAWNYLDFRGFRSIRWDSAVAVTPIYDGIVVSGIFHSLYEPHVCCCFLNQKPISRDHLLLREEGIPGVYTTNLVITGADKIQNGAFICKIENEIGEYLFPSYSQFVRKIGGSEPKLRKVTMTRNISDEESMYKTCLKLAENKYSTVLNMPQEGFCEGFICADSQLILQNKLAITMAYNNFRNDVAKSQQIGNMLKLVWHWALELEALQLAAYCKPDYIEMYGDSPVYHERRKVPGLTDGLLNCEDNVGTLTAEEKYLSNQAEFIKLLEKQLKKNFMRDFDEDGKFKRANALFIGCAMTMRDEGNGNRTMHFSCIYCTKLSEITSIESTCIDGAQFLDPHRVNLCQTVYVNIFACEPRSYCGIESKETTGITEEFYVVQTNVGTYLVDVIVSVKTNGEEESRVKLFDWNGTGVIEDPVNRPSRWFWEFGNIPALYYEFEEDSDVNRELNRDLEELTDGKLRLARADRKRDNAAVPRLRPDPVTVPYHASCCTYVFAVGLLLAIIAVAFSIYTYNALVQ